MNFISATLLGIQPREAEPTPKISVKKGKKRSNRKKKKHVAISENENVDDDVASVSDDDFTDPVPPVVVAENKSLSRIYNFESNQLEDPMHAMISKLAGQYNLSPHQVSDCVNQMWENGKKYDDYEAISAELSAKKKRVNVFITPTVTEDEFTSAPSSPVQLNPSKQGLSNSFKYSGNGKLVDEQSLIKKDSTITDYCNSNDKGGKVSINSNRKNTAVLTSEKTCVAPVTATKSTNATAANYGPPAGQRTLVVMQEKLNYVAAYSSTNLFDSLSALCSWASIITTNASTSAVDSNEALRSSNAVKEREQKAVAFFESRAMELLLTTLFSDESQQLAYRQEVKSALQALLQHILQLRDDDPTSYSTVYHLIDALDMLVRQVAATRKSEVLTAQVANSALLSKQIATCLKELYFKSNSEKSDSNNVSNVVVAENGYDNQQQQQHTEDEMEKTVQYMETLQNIDEQLTTLQLNAKQQLPAKTRSNNTSASKIPDKQQESNNKSGLLASSAPVDAEHVQNMLLLREMQSDKLFLYIKSIEVLNSAYQSASTSEDKEKRGTSYQNNNNNNNSVKKLQKQEAGKVSSSNNNSGNNNSLLLNTTIDAQLTSNISDSSAVLERALLSQSNLSPDLVAAARYQQQKQSFSSFVDRIQHERDSKLSELNNDLHSSTCRMQELTLQRTKLIEQLQRCDEDLGICKDQQKDLRLKIADSKIYYQQQLDQLLHTGDTARKTLQIHEHLSSLVAAVKHFEMKFAETLMYKRNNSLVQVLAAADNTNHIDSKSASTSNCSAANSIKGVADVGGVITGNNNSNVTVITSSTASRVRLVSNGSSTNNNSGSKNNNLMNCTIQREQVHTMLLARRQLLSDALREYANIQSECIRFLSLRVHENQSKLIKVEKHLRAFQVVAMKGSVVQDAMKEITKLKNDIDEDRQAIMQLQQWLVEAINKATEACRAASIPPSTTSSSLPLTHQQPSTHHPSLVPITIPIPALTSIIKTLSSSSANNKLDEEKQEVTIPISPDILSMVVAAASTDEAAQAEDDTELLVDDNKTPATDTSVNNKATVESRSNAAITSSSVAVAVKGKKNRSNSESAITSTTTVTNSTSSNNNSSANKVKSATATPSSKVVVAAAKKGGRDSNNDDAVAAKENSESILVLGGEKPSSSVVSNKNKKKGKNNNNNSLTKNNNEKGNAVDIVVVDTISAIQQLEKRSGNNKTVSVVDQSANVVVVAAAAKPAAVVVNTSVWKSKTEKTSQKDTSSDSANDVDKRIVRSFKDIQVEQLAEKKTKSATNSKQVKVNNRDRVPPSSEVILTASDTAPVSPVQRSDESDSVTVAEVRLDVSTSITPFVETTTPPATIDHKLDTTSDTTTAAVVVVTTSKEDETVMIGGDSLMSAVSCCNTVTSIVDNDSKKNTIGNNNVVAIDSSSATVAPPPSTATTTPVAFAATGAVPDCSMISPLVEYHTTYPRSDRQAGTIEEAELATEDIVSCASSAATVPPTTTLTTDTTASSSGHINSFYNHNENGIGEEGSEEEEDTTNSLVGRGGSGSSSNGFSSPTGSSNNSVVRASELLFRNSDQKKNPLLSRRRSTANNNNSGCTSNNISQYNSQNDLVSAFSDAVATIDKMKEEIATGCNSHTVVDGNNISSDMTVTSSSNSINTSSLLAPSNVSSDMTVTSSSDSINTSSLSAPSEEIKSLNGEEYLDRNISCGATASMADSSDCSKQIAPVSVVTLSADDSSTQDEVVVKSTDSSATIEVDCSTVSSNTQLNITTDISDLSIDPTEH